MAIWWEEIALSCYLVKVVNFWILEAMMETIEGWQSYCFWEVAPKVWK